MDKRLLELIAHWDQLGWYDRKRICLISYMSGRKIDIRILAGLVAILTLIGIQFSETHHHHKTGLQIAVALFCFYTNLTHSVYNRGAKYLR